MTEDLFSKQNISPEIEEYDPLHTMLALNMAIVSIHKISTTQDRIILQQEYSNIINRLALGNIKADNDMTGLYSELMDFITGKGLRQDEVKKLSEIYKHLEQEKFYKAFSKIKAPIVEKRIDNVFTWLGNWLGGLAVSSVSSYFSAKAAREEVRKDFKSENLNLQKQEIESCNELQKKLLTSSWNLLDKYKLPDDYRLTNESLNGFFKAVNEDDPEKRLRMLKARFIERNFQVYPPYWFYRAKSAQEAGDNPEVEKCFDKFDEVWRPILRYDPYKLETAKYRVQNLAKNPADEENISEFKKQLSIIQDYIPEGDWNNNLFLAVAYFLIGEKDEAIMCIQTNIDFDYETELSKNILSQIENNELNSFDNPFKKEIPEVTEKPKIVENVSEEKLQLEDLINLANNGNAYAQFNLGEMYHFGKNASLYFNLNIEGYVDKNYEKAFEWYGKAAEQGHVGAQNSLGIMYEFGNYVKQDYKKAYMWYYIAAQNHDWENVRVTKGRVIQNLKNLEGGWFKLAKVSQSEIAEAKAEAMKKYEEIQKRKRK